jgi:hypothetical protein
MSAATSFRARSAISSVRARREVKMGATVVIEHGRRVARVVPEALSLEERLQALKDAGAILWSGRRLGRPKPGARTRKKPALGEIVVENRG